jgi:ATP-binding cassette subfamily D (ALD) long-chain fatty acid import protein
MTQDVTRFCNNLARLYSNLTKPILDIIIYNYELAKSVGIRGLLGVSIFIHISSYILRRLTPPFGEMVAEHQKLEGEFRFHHTRLMEYAEEIALYNGAATEERIFFIMMEDFTIKYFWGAMGLLVSALPIFLTPHAGKDRLLFDVGSRTEVLITDRRLLMGSADAFGRVLSSYKDITELTGYTSRVSELINVFEDIENHHYQKTLMVSTKLCKQLLETKGTIIICDKIRFESVPIISPGGDVLVQSLSFEVKTGDHLLIVGPNGSGKSSLFRILGGLWPLYGM